ncbi:MAG: serine--tRNA ligase [Candidatus Dojkabacteria bacterium]|jgi:seryl-tRNA synthetase|nr:serine--tRNA ligase [Candidatus Dojkabacteria bacterium]MDD2270269.1 serine--tRNA ligase [Candidatus Dojkabacteria bacterium]
MIDINRITQDSANVKKALLKRVPEEELDLDKIIELDRDRKALQTEYDQQKAEQNEYNQQMAKIEKGSDEFKQLVVRLKEKSNQTKEIEDRLKQKEEELQKLVEVLPNIPDEDVVAGGKENNETIKSWGEKPKFDFEIEDHLQLGERLGILDFRTATKMSGSNFSMYRGKGAQLEWALINYFIDSHLKSGYEMIIPPHIVNEQAAYTAGQIPKFKEDVYWVNDSQCLIPTAETALTNIYREEIVEESELPKKFFAYTPCYRREAGSYRSNERGLIRVHQFNKVEMYMFSTQEQSDELFNELTQKAENLVEGLGLHYNTVKLAAGDCSAPAARTLDVEVWLPALGQYYEVSSISNAREYQARRGEMKYRPKDGSKNRYMHTLNASGLATSRLMVAMLETYQQPDGSILVPEVLQKYTGFDKIEK